MLSAYGAQVVGFVTDGEIICRDCAVEVAGELAVAKMESGLHAAGRDWTPLIRYSASREYPEGLWCGRKGEEIVAPPELPEDDDEIPAEGSTVGKYYFKNGLEASVIGHGYGSQHGLRELAVFDLRTGRIVGGDVEGWLSDDEVRERLAEIRDQEV